MTNPASYTTFMSRLLRSMSLAVAVVILSACGDDATDDIITTPTPNPITETFAGTVTVNGAATHTFTAAAAGTVTATLTSIGPDETIVSGMVLGEWNGTGCTERITNDSAVRTTVLTGNVSQAGQLCVRIRDVGRFVEPVTYEITVIHP